MRHEFGRWTSPPELDYFYLRAKILRCIGIAPRWPVKVQMKMRKAYDLFQLNDVVEQGHCHAEYNTPSEVKLQSMHRLGYGDDRFARRKRGSRSIYSANAHDKIGLFVRISFKEIVGRIQVLEEPLLRTISFSDWTERVYRLHCAEIQKINQIAFGIHANLVKPGSLRLLVTPTLNIARDLPQAKP